MKNFILITFLITGTNIFSQQTIENGLLVNYEFNNNFEDSSENNFHAFNQGSVFSVDRHGNQNSAVYFDGIDSYIDLPNEDELKPEMPFSISFWIKYSSNDFDDQEVFELSYEENRNSGVYFNSQMGTGKLAINIANGAYNYVSFARRSFVSNNEIEIENWKNIIVVVSDASDMKIYSDCIETGGNYSGTADNLVYSDTNGVLGKRQRNLNAEPNFFNGSIDDFMMWDRALSNKEISSLCQNLSNEEVSSINNNLSIYPNPTNGKLFIKSTLEYDDVLVYNQIGSKVLNLKYSNNLDLSKLQNGIYFLKFIKDNHSITKKVMLYK